MGSEALRSVTDSGDVAGNSPVSGASYRELARRQNQPRTALDPTVARLAVELSLPGNHSGEKALVPLLNALSELATLDCVFVAILDQKQSRIDAVNAAVNPAMKKCNPQTLLGAMQPCSKEMLKRLGMHQLLEVRDYNTQGSEHELLSSQIASLNLSSALVGGIHTCDSVQGLMFFGSLRRRSSWDVDTRLIMKLMSASYAAGHERLLLQSSAA